MEESSPQQLESSILCGGFQKDSSRNLAGFDHIRVQSEIPLKFVETRTARALTIEAWRAWYQVASSRGGMPLDRSCSK